ncbi:MULTISPECIES: cation diffusion facilitator family transporter [Aurantimonadaceae]|uniref:Cation diffusion facilitator family transporter n=2 Tax=Jiella pelagia TaxID=2986949 RepID=A0ABY7C693_9HYPH|nr:MULTISPECIES: cation diffusion facilitator family transporter [Aurantimonadaceae]WAP71523.1 cation diffusion facilitator family transporter [Jiella pelagia]
MTRHDHGDNHGHEGHHHHHAPATFGKAFAIGISLNIVFVAIEAGYGYAVNSVALIADAGHNLSDVFGLIVAWVAVFLGTRPPTERYTYGLHKSSILAALFNGIILLVVVGVIAWEAVRRFQDPQPVGGTTVIVVAAIGIVINGITTWLFSSGQKGDINIRGAYLHMLADTLVSAGVVVAGFAIIFTGWLWIDPVLSLVIAAVIFWSTCSLLKDSLAMSMAAVPPGIDLTAIRSSLEAMPGVTDVHDLHVWPLSTTETALTTHLVMPDGAGDGFLENAKAEMKKRFGIGHATFQHETENQCRCSLEPHGHS